MAHPLKFVLLTALGLSAAVELEAQAPTTTPPKFAYVDSRIILQRAPGSDAIQSQITK